MDQSVFPVIMEGIRQALKKPLPGREAHLKMLHRKRADIPGESEIPGDAGIAGVLILLYPDNGCIRTVFMKRTEYDGVHSGQISFPGGKMEPSDENVTQTALREAEEEMGIPRKATRVIGRLTDLYIPPSNFRVTPTVAYADSKPEFIPDPEEVAEVIEITLSDLLDKGSLQKRDIQAGPGFSIVAPCYYVNGHVIWGATSMILTEFIEVLRSAGIKASCSQAG